MLWKFTPIVLGLFLAYVWRARGVHEAWGRRRRIRAIFIWLRACVITVPAVYVLFVVILLLREWGR